MTKREIVERIAQGEDSRTQFKRGPVGVAKLAAEFAAFSNSSGGIIIFGVGDDGKVVGLGAKDKKLLDSEISNAANDNVRPDSEANFLTAKIFRQNEGSSNCPGPVNSVDAPVNGLVKRGVGPVKVKNGPVKRGTRPVSGPVNSACGPVNCPAKGEADDTARLLELIRANPGINKSVLSRMSGINARTVKRRIEETLRGKIEFRGAPKKGGYYLKEQK